MIRIMDEEIYKEACKRLAYLKSGELRWESVVNRNDLIGMEAGSVSSTDGYRYIKISGKRLLAHRIIFYKHHGFLPEYIDHINRNRLDNRIENLRAADPESNSINTSHQKNRTSIYKGVSWDSSRGLWRSSIRHKGKSKTIGRFKSEIDAAKAYDAKAIELFGEFESSNRGMYLDE